MRTVNDAKNSAAILFIALIALIALASAFAIPSPAYSQPAVYLHLRPTSCRLLDTRVTNEPIIQNEIRVFSVEPSFSSLQGGVTGCGIPVDAAGIAGVKLNIKGRATVAISGGNFRVFDADASALGVHSTLQLQGSLNFIAIQADIPVSGNQLVAIHASVESHAVVDLVGWYTVVTEP